MNFNVLFLVTDFRACAKDSRFTFSKPSLHVTCVVSTLQGVCEVIFMLYPKVEKLVADGKEIHVKFPAETDCLLKQHCLQYLHGRACWIPHIIHKTLNCGK